MAALETFDLSTESPLVLSEAAKLIPSPRTDSGTISLVTLRRWISEGIKAPDGSMVRLQAVRIGGSLVTSRESILRFTAVTSGAAAIEKRAVETSAELRAKAAMKSLEAAGYR